jgi:ubiquinone/menaquinone biosynthesis C-methylase UbiE
VREEVRQCFKRYALEIGKRRQLRSGYFAELIRRYQFSVEPDAGILEIGVGTGDLLAALRPSRGVGVDICPEMLAIARKSHPELELYEAAAEDLSCVSGVFDYIVLSDLTVHIYDILAFLESLHRFCHARTRLIFNFHSRLWQPVLYALSLLGHHHKHYRTNWVTIEDLQNLLHLAGYEVVKTDRSTLLPARGWFLSAFANRILYRLPLINHLCLVNWIVARDKVPLASVHERSVSVICPCRNEAGNIRAVIDRLPSFAGGVELIFVEGGSNDGTWETIEKEVHRSSRRGLQVKALKQSGKGKADAVRLGFSKATGDVLVILDADLSVPPEDLPTFVEVLAKGTGEFVNGSRLVYPMDERAMRFLNLIANKFFALVFSYILDQPVKDTLCGTKVLTRADYLHILKGRNYFGDFDPFGDFDLLFGAAKRGLKIVEIPVRYHERVYGQTNISRFRDGWTLIRMSWFGLKRFKFI